MRSNRFYVAGFGIVMMSSPASLQDVVAALTVAYDILVGGLLVPILGGLLWRRGTNVGAIAAMAVGTVATLATMVVLGDIYANEPIYVGLAQRPGGVRGRQPGHAPDRPRGAGGVGRALPRHRGRLIHGVHSPRSRPMTSFMISVVPP